MTAMNKIVLASLIALSACVAPVVPDTARLAPGQLGTNQDPDVAAMNMAQYAFADPSRTYGRPIDAARAAASMEYVAGEFYTSPRWSNVSAITKEQLLQGRNEVRAALGVAPGASSQAVVNRLTAAADAMQAQDRATAVGLLGAPVFTTSGEAVLARLSAMPYLRMANVSTMKAAGQLFGPDDHDYD